MVTVLQHSHAHCIGEKALFNWLLTIYPKTDKHQVRLTDFVPELLMYLL